MKTLGDNVPLYTNTREGIFIQGPSPVESSSDVQRPEFDLREQITNRLISRKNNGGIVSALLLSGAHSQRVRTGPETPQMSDRPSQHRSPSEASEADEDMGPTCFIDGLQEEIQVEGLQVHWPRGLLASIF